MERSLRQEIILRARDFAAERHKGQVRNTKEQQPYICHLEEVAELLTDFGAEDDVILAAWLHDVVEDCPPTSLEEITELFGARVTSIVAEVTDDKSLPKAERKRLQIKTAPEKSFEASLIKLADRIANVRELGASPPPEWSEERRRTYLNWSIEVVNALTHKPQALMALFERVCDETRERLS